MSADVTSSINLYLNMYGDPFLETTSTENYISCWSNRFIESDSNY